MDIEHRAPIRCRSRRDDLADAAAQRCRRREERLHSGNPMAHGFPVEMLEELVIAGLAKASSEEIPRGRRKRRKSRGCAKAILE
jgi:hypothetical protein